MKAIVADMSYIMAASEKANLAKAGDAKLWV
jgi:hypothetical protein